LAVFLTARWAYVSRSSWALRLLGVLHAVFGLVLGLPGLLGALMWAFTEHTVTYRNENLFLSNPLTFALLPIGVAMLFGSKRALAWARPISYLLLGSSLLLLVLKLIPSFDQDVSLPMSVLLPANLGFALAHRMLAARKISAAPRVGDAGGEAVPSA
jgi:phosphoglycerol transferase MdoB-like AlkP superfamily enzyme